MTNKESLSKQQELMKKMIEQKKLKSASQKNNKRSDKQIGEYRPAFKQEKQGGLFDK